ncbi:uncharacterized protein B0H18DRAFT_958924, partial [Fomitopsis serialis]|uniref:uncharacterized protein n=1 Tax=Fomitopsis serialis TaxID=139415 RepID=UPI002008D663
RLRRHPPPGSPRSRADILSQAEADDPGVPAYAVDLLDALVASELDVSLRTPAFAHGPPRAPRRARARERVVRDRRRADPRRHLPPALAARGVPRALAVAGTRQEHVGDLDAAWINVAIPRPRASASKAGAGPSNAQRIRRSLHLGGLGASKSNPNMKAAAAAHAHAHSRLGSGSPLRSALAQTSSSLSSVPESLASSTSDDEDGNGNGDGRRRRRGGGGEEKGGPRGGREDGGDGRGPGREQVWGKRKWKWTAAWIILGLCLRNLTCYYDYSLASFDGLCCVLVEYDIDNQH